MSRMRLRQESGCVHGDAGGTGAGFGADHNFDVVSQGDEEAHEALDGIAVELVVEQGRDFWLRDAEGRRDFGLGEALLFHDAANGGREPSWMEALEKWSRFARHPHPDTRDVGHPDLLHPRSREVWALTLALNLQTSVMGTNGVCVDLCPWPL
jgi:hypothetical protein